LVLNIVDLDANALSQAIHARTVSCREVMQAYLKRIDACNEAVLALVSRPSNEILLAQADSADAQLAQGQSLGWMHGMPQAIKDLAVQKDFACTSGSRLMKDQRPTQDSLMVARMRQAGAIFVGRTNVPESGLGSHSYNHLFGTTRNPWDTTKTAGGSSGGAAVALALHMLPVADGSDFMGSLRNPAGWNNVLGMRPSQGRVPAWPNPDVWIAQMGTEGPMGRTAGDVARLLAIQSGPDDRAPLARQDRFDLNAALMPAVGATIRVGWLGDLGAYLPTDPGVLTTCESALKQWQGHSVTVEPVQFKTSLQMLWDCWLVWRRALVGPRIALQMALSPQARDFIKPEAQWEFDQAAHTSANELTQASAQRTSFYQECLGLFERYDVLALPSAQVWPFDASLDWPKQIAGRTMDTYHRWMEATIYATLLGAPTVCVPAGFGGPNPAKPLPMGIQLIGRPGADAQVLSIAAHYEQTVMPAMKTRHTNMLLGA
jgi:amidase